MYFQVIELFCQISLRVFIIGFLGSFLQWRSKLDSKLMTGHSGEKITLHFHLSTELTTK